MRVSKSCGEFTVMDGDPLSCLSAFVIPWYILITEEGTWHVYKMYDNGATVYKIKHSKTPPIKCPLLTYHP